MEIIQQFIPLLGVVIGALITGVGTLVRARGERRRQIALALCDLLEFRHHVVAVELVLSEIQKRVNLPPEFFPALRNLIDATFPVEPELHKRYEEAVSILAGVDPLFAFYLRSKTTMPRGLAALRTLNSQDGVSQESFELLEQQLTSIVIPAINEAAIALAKHHSLWSWWRVRRVIDASGILPAEVEPILEKLQALSLSEANIEQPER